MKYLSILAILSIASGCSSTDHKVQKAINHTKKASISATSHVIGEVVESTAEDLLKSTASAIGYGIKKVVSKARYSSKSSNPTESECRKKYGTLANLYSRQTVYLQAFLLVNCNKKRKL